MRILTLEPGFPPELASGRLAFEFAKNLSLRGNKVAVVTVFPRRYLLSQQLSIPKSVFFYWEQANRFETLRVRPQFLSNALSVRAIEYIIVPISLLIGGLISLTREKFDVVHCSSPPMFVGLVACFLGKVARLKVIVRVQDIHPDALVKLGLLKNSFLVKILEFVEKFIYVSSDHITVTAEGIKKHIVSDGIDPRKVSYVPNWADVSRTPDLRGNDFRMHNGLMDKFVVTYAGNMSLPQDLMTIVEAASILRQYEDIRFLLVGDGVQRKSLEERSKRLKLENVKFLPLQQRDVYFEILHASDVCLVSLKRSHRSPAIPSKMQDIMALRKPIIGNVPSEEDVAEILKKAECGLHVEPEAPRLLGNAILTLYHDPVLAEKLGKNGREYLEKNFSLSACLERYEEIIVELTVTKEAYNRPFSLT